MFAKNANRRHLSFGNEGRMAVRSAPQLFERSVANDGTGERSTSVPSLPVPPASKCSGCQPEKRWDFRRLRTLHQIGAVIRFREFGPQRTVFGQLLLNEVNSPTTTTLENKKKIRPEPERENDFVGASGGGNESRTQLSLVPASNCQGPARKQAQI